jgi:hypothetical protein
MLIGTRSTNSGALTSVDETIQHWEKSDGVSLSA